MRFGIAAAAAVSTLLIVTGCAGTAVQGGGAGKTAGAESAYKKYAALTGDERRDALVEAAEKEGKLSLYTSLTDDITTAIKRKFEKDFDIDLEVYRAGSSTVLTKMAQEYQAKTQGADVVETNALEMFALNEMGALADYAGERRDLVAEEGQYDGWTATRYNVFSPSWNTDLVKPEEVPTKWEHLADPKWKGRLALELEDYDWYMDLHQYWESQGKSKNEIDKLFVDIAHNAEVQKGHTTMADLHQSGKFDLAVSNYTYIVEQKKRAGAPLDYLPLVDPVFIRANGVGLVKNAAHPAAAMLFADWMLDEGQTVLSDLGLTVAILPEGKADPLAGVEQVYQDDQELIKNSSKWDKAYQEVLSNVGGN